MSGPDAAAEVALEGPYDLSGTFRRDQVVHADPSVRHAGAGEVWAAFRTPAGPATVRYLQRGVGVKVEAFGEGAREAVRAAPSHLGALDPSWTVQSDHPIVGPLLERARGVRFGRSGRMFERLLAVIVSQKVTSAGATRSYRDLVFRHGERAPGPGRLWIPPRPEALRGLRYADLHPFGIERRRAETILFVARRARRLEALAFDEPAQVHARLLAFPGIGPWTAGLVTSAVHGDPDALPVGDYHIKNHVAFTLAGEPRADDARMLALLEPFRPYRGRVLAAILAHGVAAPRFGPRLSVRDIRGS